MIKKNSANKVINSHGGADAYRFELLVIRYMKNLLTPSAYRICDLIEKLGVVM
jgi:hypothetical protein